MRNKMTPTLFVWKVCNRLKLLNLLSDKAYLKFGYRAKMGKKLDLQTPKTFNEKLQWLKLYDRKPEYTKMVDKFEAKKYVAEKIGEEYIIPTLGVWNSFDEIDFDKLPDQFVLKCTHDSGGLVICRDKSKLNVEEARKKIEKSLKTNYYLHGREWPYKDVKPRIIAEKYMEDKSNASLTDYKFMCFGGRVYSTFTCTNRFSDDGIHVTFFDKEWNVMPFERSYPADKNGVPKPLNYKKMVELAEKLANGIPFVRVDFYEVREKIYFGELTFFPGSGMEAFQPEEWDYKFGEWITLPERTEDKKQ